jgi:hypothetical protein
LVFLILYFRVFSTIIGYFSLVYSRFFLYSKLFHLKLFLMIFLGYFMLLYYIPRDFKLIYIMLL